MWSIKKYVDKAGKSKTLVLYKGEPINNVSSYWFGAKEDLDSSYGVHDQLHLTINTRIADIEKCYIEDIRDLETKYSKEDVSPKPEDKEFSLNILEKSFAAEQSMRSKKDPIK